MLQHCSKLCFEVSTQNVLLNLLKVLSIYLIEYFLHNIEQSFKNWNNVEWRNFENEEYLCLKCRQNAMICYGQSQFRHEANKHEKFGNVFKNASFFFANIFYTVSTMGTKWSHHLFCGGDKFKTDQVAIRE